MAAPDRPPGSLRVDNARCVDFSIKKASLCSLYIDDGVIKAKTPGRGHRRNAARNIDLHGQYVIPGFIDGHTHLISTGIEMQRLDLSRCRSLDECLQRMSAQAKSRALVFASNWDEAGWRRDERDHLNRKTLDRISRKKPLIMRRVCGHYAVVNTPALRRIDKKWTIVDRRHGLLYEDVVLNLNDIFTPTLEMLEKALALATRKALRLGITSVHEIGNPKRFHLLQKYQDDLKVRFALYLTHRHHDKVIASGLSTGHGDDRLRFAGTKVYIDGSIGARTAAIRGRYKGTQRSGRILFSAQRLERLVRSAEAHGIQLMIHSIGDRSTDMILDVLEKNIPQSNPLRHRIEHLEMLGDRAIRTIGRRKIIASMQPNFVRRWQNPGGMYEKIIGAEYLTMNCFRSLIKARAKVVFGSDCMPLGPLYGMPGAVSHPSPRCKLDIAEAFRLYTEAGAYATFEEKKKGKLEPGYFADLLVLNENPLEKKNLSALRIKSVMVGGRFVIK